MMNLSPTQLTALTMLNERRDRGCAVSTTNQKSDLAEGDWIVSGPAVRALAGHGLVTEPLTVRGSRRVYITNAGVDLLTPADRCPVCGVELTEPPTTDDCPSPEDHALPPIDEDDDGPFSVEHVHAILREDIDADDYDRWEDMAR